jgi:hypothetical protein
MYEAASTCYVDLAVISLNLDNVLEVPAGLTGYRETATIRTQILTCGAMLGRAGRRVVVHLSESWGGLKTRIPLLGDEEAECITGHVDQFSAHAGASFADFFANHHEAPLHAPTEQLQTELADAIVLVQRGPRFHSLCGPPHPLGQLGDYNVGRVVLFQIVQQLAVEEARISSQQADLLALSPQCKSFLEKFLRPTCGSAVAAAEPAVEEEVRFPEHRQ